MHSFISILFFYLAFHLLKRNYNRSTLILSAFYIFPGLAFVLNIIFFPYRTTVAGYVLYIISAFLLLFGQIFIVIFIINLFYTDQNFWLKNQNLIIFSYAIIILIVLNIPGLITIIEGTPVYSWVLLIISYIIFSLFIVIPTIIFSVKLYNIFEDETLKRKLKYFFIGIIGMYFAYYGLILYNTWFNPLFRSIWAILVFLTVVPSGILIFYGVG